MENGSSKAIISDFLKDNTTKELFAKVDYNLKDGVHIQQHESQYELYHYIAKNIDSLKIYYNELFKVNLTSGGNYPDKYYYLDFDDPNNKGNISSKHRDYLDNEYIVIGFIIYEIIFIQNQIELNSISELQRKIRVDYEDIKEGLYRIIGKSKGKNPINFNDDTIDNTINSALLKFDKIGWVKVRGNTFELLPAFDRLIKFYEKDILNIEETLKALK